MEAKDLDEIIQKAKVQIFQDAGGESLSYHQIGQIIEKVEKISFKAGLDEGYKRGLAMKPNPDGVYENGKRDGKQAGIREMVEWVKSMQIPDDPTGEPYRGLVIIAKAQLAAKLKEWEVVEESEMP